MKMFKALFVALVLLCATAEVWADSEGSFVTPDKVRIFYKIVGSGSETLVAVHGGPGNSLESIRVDLEPMAKDRRVIYYDQRGQGRSEVITDGTKSPMMSTRGRTHSRMSPRMLLPSST